MLEPALKICFDAKNVLIERSEPGEPELPSSHKKDAEPLTRRAPKSPPNNAPRREPTDD